MKTFQDLMATNESERGEFCVTAIQAFRGSPEYRLAKDGESYYNKHNVTIENFQKFLYTVSGRQVPDIFSANYKLKTLFFRRLITQQVQYVLGNGIFMNDSENKVRLGRDFDFQLQTAAKKAMTQGRAFGFWNMDHLEVFGYADTPNQPGFCPLYDEKTAALRAGIRFWSKSVNGKSILRYTLYEEDGYTEYMHNDDGVSVIEDKRSYKQIISETSKGVINVDGENYSALPIVPLYANDSQETELVGIRESIDCYDFIKSGLANDIDDTSGFFWILKNTGGMDEADLAQFVQRMKTVKATVIDGDQGVDAEAHTLDVPVEARSKMLELLRRDIYEDFQALDVTTLSAAAKTTQEIQAAYQAQDNKCADFEYFLLDFVQSILQLAGIDDEPTFRWNRVVNMQEQTQTVLMAAQYLDDETIINHLPFLTPEEAADVVEARKVAEYDQFSGIDDDEDDSESELLSQYGEEVAQLLEDLVEGI